MPNLSDRTNWDLHPNVMTQLLAHKQADGASILDLTLSNPTLAGFTYDDGAIRAALSASAKQAYQPDPKGLPAARHAVAAYYHERRISVDPDRILLCTGTSEAYSFLFKLLCDPGDEILIPVPSYPLFGVLSELEAVQTRPYGMVFHPQEGWRWDDVSIRSQISDRTRAIVAISPNNPTGSTLRKDELAMLAAICRERQLACIVDEVFLDYFQQSPEFPSAAANPECLTFVLSGLSKVVGLPQMKLSWIVAGGPGSEEAMSRLEFIADAYLSVGLPVQAAAPVLLDSAGRIQTQIRSRVEKNARVFRDAFAADNRFGLFPSEGGWYAVLGLPPGSDDEATALGLLDRYNVLVQPGYYYDFEGQPAIVLSLLPPGSVFQEGVSRIASFFSAP
jgi:alanine-synthesizing transaminase